MRREYGRRGPTCQDETVFLGVPFTRAVAAVNRGLVGTGACWADLPGMGSQALCFLVWPGPAWTPPAFEVISPTRCCRGGLTWA